MPTATTEIPFASAACVAHPTSIATVDSGTASSNLMASRGDAIFLRNDLSSFPK